MVSERVPTNSIPFHILALSGGGYKGLYTAQIIAKFESYSGKPFGSHFDLICGTSIGGILALALATREVPAQRVVTELQSCGPKLFRPLWVPAKRWLKIPFLWAAKHDNRLLKTALTNIFNKLKVEDLKTRALIPTANWTKGGPQFFKTPHNPNFVLDGKRNLVDIGMATSAAPIYLPNYEFEHQVYVDGGIVGNAPGIFGVHEAEHFIAEPPNKDIHLLSIGALASRITANQRQPLDKGLFRWRAKIFEFMLACQEQTANFMMKQKLGDRYHMIDITTSAEQDKAVALDKANSGATKTLLGLANISFQQEIKNTPLSNHLAHQAPDLIFNSQ